MKKLNKILVLLLSAVLLTACGQNASAVTGESTTTQAVTTQNAEDQSTGTEDSGDGKITIVYTNDIHSYIANTKSSDSSSGSSSGETQEEPALRISKISQMVKDMREEGKNVLLVDCGDEIQGNAYGSYDKGKSVIDIMNAAGYQLAAPGNHDFDFGMDRFYEVLEQADYPFISCNFHSLEDEDKDLDDYKIFEIGGKKIAFIGITTPETITTSTPTIFQNDNGEYIYSFDGTDDAEKLYEVVQNTIDEVKDEADYIIALGHLGVGADEQKNEISSLNVIANTSGLDAFIDGHSHTVMESQSVADKDGNEVILTQTGAYLANVGIMEIEDDGTVTTTTKLVDDYENTDETVAVLEQNLIDAVEAEYGQQIANLDSKLYINNPENDSQRLIRSQEMNIGDFVADSIYWFYNMEAQLDCDIVVSNSGGIRTNMEAGEVTMNDVLAVAPFGNVVCLISATGQQIKDALEMGATVAGGVDPDTNSPSENGGFLQAAGLKYTVDSSIISSVETDANGMFVSVNGAYRVTDIEVYNKETGEYEAMDLNKTYTVGGIDYILRNSGNGMSMFADCALVVDYSGIDCDIMGSYIKSFAQNDGFPEINTANSPLSSCTGYLLDYENPYGAGRIIIK